MVEANAIKSKSNNSIDILWILLCAGLGAVAAYLIWVKLVFNNRIDCDDVFVTPLSNCTTHIYNSTHPIGGWDQFFGSMFTFFGAVAGATVGKGIAICNEEQAPDTTDALSKIDEKTPFCRKGF